MTVEVVVPTWNTREITCECLESLAREPNRCSGVVVVDNASSDGTAAMVADRFPRARFVRNDANLGFAAAANRGVRETHAPYVLVLNSDARLEPDALETLCRVLDEDDQVGLVGCEILDPDGSFQASHAPFPTLLGELLILSGAGRLLYGRWYPSRAPSRDAAVVTADYVSGACLLIRRAAFDAVGGFDESFFLYAEEVDLCRRLHDAGWKVAHAPGAKVRHRGGASSARAQREAALYRGRVLYFRKHQGAAATAVLKAMILASVAAKRLAHGVVGFASKGRRGRPVVDLATVRAALRGI
jgi:GT2 family glycosyltransferase